MLPSALLHSFVHECHLCLQKPLEFTNPLSGAWGEGEKGNGLRRERTSDSFHPYPSDHP